MCADEAPSRTCPPHRSSPRRCGRHVPSGRKRPRCRGRFRRRCDKSAAVRQKGRPPHEKHRRRRRTDPAHRISAIAPGPSDQAAPRTDRPQTPCGVRDTAPHRLNRMSIPVKTRNENCWQRSRTPDRRKVRPGIGAFNDPNGSLIGRRHVLHRRCASLPDGRFVRNGRRTMRGIGPAAYSVSMLCPSLLSHRRLPHTP